MRPTTHVNKLLETYVSGVYLPNEGEKVSKIQFQIFQHKRLKPNGEQMTSLT